MIYLFSSTSRKQYLQDVLNILALPYNAMYHFRYIARWVDPALLIPDSKSNMASLNTSVLKSYRNREAVVVLVDQPQSSDERNDISKINFFPLRQALIMELEPDGTTLHVYFSVKSFIDWHNLTPDLSTQKIRTISDSKCPPKIYLSITSDKPNSAFPLALQASSTSAWERIVTQLDSLEPFRNTVYFRVSDIKRVNKWLFYRSSSSLETKEILPYCPGYELQSGHLHIAELSFFQPTEVKKPVEGSKIIPMINEDYFVNEPEEVSVNFRYDKVLIPLDTKVVSQDTVSAITFKTETSSKVHKSGSNLPAEEDIVKAPAITLYLRISSPKSLLYLGFFILLLAQLLVAFAASSDKILASTSIVTLSGEVKQSIIALSPLLSIIGSTVTTVILFLLLRRLPGE